MSVGQINIPSPIADLHLNFAYFYWFEKANSVRQVRMQTTYTQESRVPDFYAASVLTAAKQIMIEGYVPIPVDVVTAYRMQLITEEELMEDAPDALKALVGILT